MSHDQPDDAKLAGKYGGFVSYQSETSPVKHETYGEDGTAEFDRLLTVYITPETRALDIGCGAGQITVATAAHAGEIWGVDEVAELIDACSKRAAAAGANNAHFIAGKRDDPAVLDALPGSFDVIYSRRGPNLDFGLADRLREGGFFIQLLVSEFNGYPLREIFGRHGFSPYHFSDENSHLLHYARMGLQPVSAKSYFSTEYFRDIDHVEAFLQVVPAMLRDWRQGPAPYDPQKDRDALELYARYNTTPDGIAILQHRRVFVLRKETPYYPSER